MQHITLPDAGYEYFLEWNNFPFQPHATEFSWVNALRLLEASMLAYGDQPFIDDKLKKAGSPFEGKLFSKGSTQYLLLSNEEFVIVAFRGTEFPKPDPNPLRFIEQYRSMFADVVTDVNFKLTPFENYGRAHNGFAREFNQIRDELAAKLAGLRPRAVWFTGHSLGAALATLASVHFQTNNAIYTFGSPMVGDGAFAEAASKNHYRFVNNNDFVANLLIQKYALPFSYVHSRTTVYFDSNGNHVAQSNLFDRLLGAIKQPFSAFGNLVFNREFTLPTDNFNDHLPRNYAENIRKNM
jgi:triacylglycerol lipase